MQVAARAEAPIERGLAGPGLLAYIVTSKFADYLPLYRLEDIFARQGFEIARATQAVWCGDVADLVEPLYRRMAERVRQSHVVATDDTVLPMLSAGKTQPARMWVYVGDAAHPYNVFDFTLRRTRDGPQEFLKNFTGVLLADAYGGYNGVVAGNGLTRAGCWSHARRTLRRGGEHRAGDRPRGGRRAARVVCGRTAGQGTFRRRTFSTAPGAIGAAPGRTAAEITALERTIAAQASHGRSQLGWLPRLRIKQTSSEGYGQIYVGVVNWLLMIVTVGLTASFGKSDNLAAAYGIAVSLTMLMTSALLFIAMREIWGWSLLAAGAVAGFFLPVDSAFFLANLTKIAEGGYVPLILAVSVYGVMWIWHRGAAAISLRLQDALIPVGAFMQRIKAANVPRVPGTAVFLTRTERDTPPVMIWHVKHNRALHEHVFVLRVEIQSIPWVSSSNRLAIAELVPNFWRAEARFEFMERPHIPELLADSKSLGCTSISMT